MPTARLESPPRTHAPTATASAPRSFATRLAAPLALAALAPLLACGGGDAEDESGSGAIKVGAIFDLTGPTSDVGTFYADGIRGYVEWLNQNGGLDGQGRQIELLAQDYGYKVDQAEQLYSQFVGEGAVAFMGWGTGDTEALRGRIAEDEIPFMSASYSHVLGNPEEAPFNFLSGTSYTHQFQIVLDWMLAAAQEAGEPAPTRIAVMHNASPFGLSPIEQGGRVYATSLGLQLDAIEMPRGATDFTAELTRIKNAGIRHVVFQNTSGPVAVVLRGAQSLGLDLDFACLNWCSNAVLTELAGDAAEGVLGSILYAPPGEGVTGLDDAAAFLESQGSSIEEKGLLFGQGWWTMGLLAEGMRRALAASTDNSIDGDDIRRALETFDDFETGGVTAPVSFSPTDHRGMKGMRIFEVQEGRWTPRSGLLTATD
ncbi:MAG: branched-chain amino acid ABC transporter substrate-binding protein [Acidobacteria bacterium]|nr:MAG: branched-chain amino acid ABC transporter substrate-binding protein [Acidobacteriota bacterium]